jgi:hypothetical protein
MAATSEVSITEDIATSESIVASNPIENDPEEKIVESILPVTDLLAQIGVNENEVDKMPEYEETWEVKAHKQAEESKEESKRILRELGIEDADCSLYLKSQEVWEVKSDKELSEVRKEISSVRMELGVDDALTMEYEEVWEKKAEVEKANGWNEPPANSQLTAYTQISQWFSQLSKMISETKIF